MKMGDQGIERRPQGRNTELLRKLSDAVNGHAATATFALGGSIPISYGKNSFGTEFAGCPPVRLICDDDAFPMTDSYDKACSITFPKPGPKDYDDKQEQYDTQFDKLLKRCQVATFGLDGEDVLNEEYRKARKLDPTVFCTNFHPHDQGILDSIQQGLLPSTVRGGLELAVGPQGIRAELYKLNIYSGPSGKFRPHVDTPRGPTQFGSLVVCLPTHHEGGILRVKHRDQTIDFDWATKSDQQVIQWAAFYGDCEHEVLEVTAGHRITFSYNLYYSFVGEVGRAVHVPHQFPFYNIARDIVQEPTFLPHGGLIGFYCSHQYAHATNSGRKSLPHAFKGVDLAIYSVFRNLGFNVGVHPIIKNEQYQMGGMSYKQLMRDTHDLARPDHVEYFLRKLEKAQIAADKARAKDSYSFDRETEYTTSVGTELHGPTCQDYAGDGYEYGNEASMTWEFSAAAILVVVPRSGARLRQAANGGGLDFSSLPLHDDESHSPCSDTGLWDNDSDV
ncbi:MAG: hypothetical protein Q9174_001062 [Haloplaca sp. 1 TL-2023]